MSTWNFTVQSQPEAVVAKLKARLGANGAFVFDTEGNQGPSRMFRFRKRVLYPFQILHRNRTAVRGRVSSNASGNRAAVDIEFKQHIALYLTISTWFIAGVVMLIWSFFGQSSLLLPGAVMLFIGLLFWWGIRKKSTRDAEEYKTLISEILEL